MADARKLNDDLLGGIRKKPKVNSAESSSQLDDLMTSRHDDKSSSLPPTQKKRVTFYLPVELVKELRAVKFEVEQKTGKGGYATSQSTILEAGLRALIDDYHAQGDSSFLMNWVHGVRPTTNNP